VGLIFKEVITADAVVAAAPLTCTRFETLHIWGRQKAQRSKNAILWELDRRSVSSTERITSSLKSRQGYDLLSSMFP
jgi:hypothetical protein